MAGRTNLEEMRELIEAKGGRTVRVSRGSMAGKAMRELSKAAQAHHKGTRDVADDPRYKRMYDALEETGEAFKWNAQDVVAGEALAQKLRKEFHALGVRVATHGGDVREYADRSKITDEVLPLIAIPTTAGTGSEVTFGAVITDTENHFKFTVKHQNTAPKIALVDPKLTLSMPPALTASTGMDALTHAIEAYTAVVAEPLADANALYAIELITAHLKTAVFDGNNLEARAGMLLGSLLAGIAFSHSDVAAVHCIAEALGGKYDAPHGVCNAVTLSEIMAYNIESCQERYARVATAMGIDFTDITDGACKAVDAVQQLANDVNLPSFRSLGVKEEDLEELARNAAINGSNKDNPRPMDEDDYLCILKRLLAKE